MVVTLRVSLAAVCYMLIVRDRWSLRVGGSLVVGSQIGWRIALRYCLYRGYLAAGLDRPRLWWETDWVEISLFAAMLAFIWLMW